MLHITGERTMEEYLNIIRSSQILYVDEVRREQAVQEARFRSKDLEYLCLQTMRKDRGGRYSSLSKANIVDYLEDMGVEFTKRFLTPSGEPSLDISRVINPLIERGIAVEFLTMYKEMRSYESHHSFLKKMGTRCAHKGYTNGRRLIGEYTTNIEERENLRVYYSDLALVSVPKEFSNIITGPSEEYHVAWADYPQADWRFAYNLFIRDETNEDIMRGCTDAYEGLARIVEGEQFNPEEFKSKRKLYKVDCLSVFYNSQNKKPVARAMHDYFVSRKKYSDYVTDLSILYRFKRPVPIKSYFGYEQLIPEAQYESAFLSKGLNTPIQTFTSHVVNETVLGLLERFWDLGYTPDDINIYYVRHDEIILLFKDTILKDSWVFKDCSEIHIDGFTPIHLDFHFGEYYKEESAELTERVNTYINSCDDRLHTYPVGERHEYNPVPSVGYVYMCVYPRVDGVSCRFYDYKTKQTYSYLMPCGNPQERAEEAIEQYVLPAVGNTRYLLVANQQFEWINRIGPDEGTLLQVINKSDNSVVMRLYGEEQEGAQVRPEAN